ncbi:hypothetical protein M405DRAFT_276706 [Rhizopogon salebrosus TDB-379]|nr:hypothetical protein M405DRAFT_276706 [Rhizopogon salebrosus TDB-379]
MLSPTGASAMPDHFPSVGVDRRTDGTYPSLGPSPGAISPIYVHSHASFPCR